MLIKEVIVSTDFLHLLSHVQGASESLEPIPVYSGLEVR